MSIQPETGTDLDIRPAERSDRPLLKELLRESMSLLLVDLLVRKPRAFERRVDDQFQHYYDRSDKVIWVAQKGAIPVGYIWLQPMYDPLVDVHSYLVINVGVRPEFRCQGVATRLFHYAREYCRRQEVARVRLFVYSTNERARRLYEKLGFTVGFIEMNWDVPLPDASASGH